jgi:hypothetical protein
MTPVNRGKCTERLRIAEDLHANLLRPWADAYQEGAAE